MALKATIHKAVLTVADLDRHYYAEHALTLARHPSETEERMMVRVLAFALFAADGLSFGRGVSTEDEPDLWRRDPTGTDLHWILVGQPDERWIRKACARAERVAVISFGRAADIWWSGIKGKLARLSNLTVLNLAPDTAPALARLTARSMRLQCTVQDGQVWMTDGQETVTVEPTRLLSP